MWILTFGSIFFKGASGTRLIFKFWSILNVGVLDRFIKLGLYGFNNFGGVKNSSLLQRFVPKRYLNGHASNLTLYLIE